MKKPITYIPTGKKITRGGISLSPTGTMAIIIVVVLMIIMAVASPNGLKNDYPYAIEVKYTFKMMHETDSLQFWEYSRGANRQDLYYDKKGKRWFK